MKKNHNSSMGLFSRQADKKSPLNLFGRAVGVIAVIGFSIFPAYWMITTAFDAQAATRGARLIPENWTLAHFDRVFADGTFFIYIRNSLIVAGGTVLISAFVALLAAVAVSRFQFGFRKSVLILILIVQMVPLEALVIPLFLQAKTLGLLNSLIGLIIVYLAFSLPFAIWTLKGFVAAVPKEIEEAAYMDGASWGRMFWTVLVPLVAPGVVATSVFAFITAWNEFIFALTFMQQSDKYTVAVGLQKFFGENSTEWAT